MTNKKNSSTKRSDTKNGRKQNAEKNRKTEDTKSRGVVFMLFGLIFALWFIVAFVSNLLSSDLNFGSKILQVISFICNFGVAMVLVYYGFSLFVQKAMKISGWQLIGWLCIFFSVAGMLHLSYCPQGFSFGGLWDALKAACFGYGGGICGFVPAYLIHFVPSAKIQYVLFWAFAILGAMLGTNMKIVDRLANIFDRDPEKIAQRKAKRDAKEAKRAMKKAEKAQKAEEAVRKQQQISLEEVASNIVEDEKEPAEKKADDGIVRDSKDESFLISPIITDYRGHYGSDEPLGAIEVDKIEDRDAVYVGREFNNLDDLHSLDDFDAAAVNDEAAAEQPAEDYSEIPLPDEPPAAEETASDFAAASESGKNVIIAETKPKNTVKTKSEAKKEALPPQPAVRKVPYKLPPLSLLDGGPHGAAGNSQKLKDDSLKLENVLASFGVKAKVVEVVCGPAIIRYELQPAPGVKVSKIVNLQDDIALALAAKGLRIEAPVPGKSVIGIEVAKPEITAVYFKDVVSSQRFKDNSSKLSIAFGIDINGNPVIGDLASMPHLLIAGATGSGKSVCMNTLICSLLFKAKPEEVKIIMIDPKKVELAGYNGLPHLGRPVVTDPKKASLVLKEVVNEMDRRYTVFTACGVKNFKAYNQIPEVEKMPQIVVLIDELADLMMVASRDVENHIVRLTQLARAAGIHLVIATQRPSVDVITGLIKANIPSRIAFAVSSMVDSRTILDMGGAEKLLGKGDMLYHPIGLSRPIRVQGAFLSEDEIERLVKFCSKQAAQEFIEFPDEVSEEEAEDEQESLFEDALFIDACKTIFDTGQASASYLQRRFRIGYNRAARLIEDMEAMGIVSPPDGKRRKVLMSEAEFTERYLSRSEDEYPVADDI
ncbi:MAG: DNA translocase FtsK [Bacillota bacterium]|jgi:DNA segregation ATPase FtsK/SpoIIIE-like protein